MNTNQLSQLLSFYQILKNQEIQQEARESKSHRFILLHPSTRATSSPLHHCKDFHYEKDQTN